jgi:hypothetical protein
MLVLTCVLLAPLGRYPYPVRGAMRLGGAVPAE